MLEGTCADNQESKIETVTIWVELGTSSLETSASGAQAPTLGDQTKEPCADRDVRIPGLALNQEILSNRQQGI